MVRIVPNVAIEPLGRDRFKYTLEAVESIDQATLPISTKSRVVLIVEGEALPFHTTFVVYRMILNRSESLSSIRRQSLVSSANLHIVRVLTVLFPWALFASVDNFYDALRVTMRRVGDQANRPAPLDESNYDAPDARAENRSSPWKKLLFKAFTDKHSRFVRRRKQGKVESRSPSPDVECSPAPAPEDGPGRTARTTVEMAVEADADAGLAAMEAPEADGGGRSLLLSASAVPKCPQIALFIQFFISYLDEIERQQKRRRFRRQGVSAAAPAHPTCPKHMTCENARRLLGSLCRFTMAQAEAFAKVYTLGFGVQGAEEWNHTMFGHESYAMLTAPSVYGLCEPFADLAHAPLYSRQLADAFPAHARFGSCNAVSKRLLEALEDAVARDASVFLDASKTPRCFAGFLPRIVPVDVNLLECKFALESERAVPHVLEMLVERGLAVGSTDGRIIPMQRVWAHNVAVAVAEVWRRHPEFTSSLSVRWSGTVDDGAGVEWRNGVWSDAAVTGRSDGPARTLVVGGIDGMTTLEVCEAVVAVQRRYRRQVALPPSVVFTYDRERREGPAQHVPFSTADRVLEMCAPSSVIDAYNVRDDVPVGTPKLEGTAGLAIRAQVVPDITTARKFARDTVRVFDTVCYDRQVWFVSRLFLPCGEPVGLGHWRYDSQGVRVIVQRTRGATGSHNVGLSQVFPLRDGMDAPIVCCEILHNYLPDHLPLRFRSRLAASSKDTLPAPLGRFARS